MEDPQAYEVNRAGTLSDTEEILPSFIKVMSWKHGEEILDYGCGAGSVPHKYYLPMAIKFDSQITAVDISPEMIEYAKTNYPDSRINYLVGDIQKTDSPLLSRQFDKIFSFYVLHFIKDYRNGLYAFQRMLKPGGQMGFAVVTRIDCYRALQKFGTDPKWSEYLQGYESYIPEWFEKNENAEQCFTATLNSFGTNILDIKTHLMNHRMEFNAVLDLFFSLYPYSSKIPKELMEEFKDGYRVLIADYNGIKPDSNFVDFKYEVVSCLSQKP